MIQFITREALKRIAEAGLVALSAAAGAGVGTWVVEDAKRRVKARQDAAKPPQGSA